MVSNYRLTLPVGERKEWVNTSNLPLSFPKIAVQSYYNYPEMSYQGLQGDDLYYTIASSANSINLALF